MLVFTNLNAESTNDNKWIKILKDLQKVKNKNSERTTKVKIKIPWTINSKMMCEEILLNSCQQSVTLWRSTKRHSVKLQKIKWRQNSYHIQVEWGSEYRTSLVFKWLKVSDYWILQFQIPSFKRSCNQTVCV